MHLVIPVALALACAAFNLYAVSERNRKLIYVTKPLTMTFVIWLAVAAALDTRASYGNLIVVGLIWSLAGDVLLMLPSDKFVAGLLSFLAAHLFYIAAFAFELGGIAPLLYVVPFLVIAAGAFVALRSYLGSLRVPVVIYMTVIVVMAWQAYGLWAARGTDPSARGLAGACHFLVSDMLLAFDRFRGPYRGAQLWVMATYFVAQLLIASSIVP